MEDFSQPKIVWGEISDRSKFAYESDGKYIPEATTFLMVGQHLPFLFCILNSPLAEWFFSKVGTTTGVGTVRWKKYTIQELLIPNISNEQFCFFEDCVKNYVSGIYNSQTLAAKVNERIYKIVGLTVEEICYVNSYYPALS